MHIAPRNRTIFAAPIMADDTPQPGSKHIPLDRYAVIIVISLLLVLSFPAICVWHYCISPRLRHRKAPNQEVLSISNGCKHSFGTVSISAPLACNTLGSTLTVQRAHESYEPAFGQEQQTQWERQLPQNLGQGRLFQHVDSVRDGHGTEFGEVNADNSMRKPLPTCPQAEPSNVAGASQQHHTTYADVEYHRHFSASEIPPTLPNSEKFAKFEQDVVDSIPQSESSTAVGQKVQHVGALRPVQIKRNSFQAESNSAELDFTSPSEGRSADGCVQDVGASRTMEMKRNSFQEASHSAVIEEAPRNSVLSEVEMGFGQVLRPSSSRPVLRLSIPTAKELGLRDAVLVDPKDLRDLRGQSKRPGLQDTVLVDPKEARALRRQSKRQSLR